MNGLSSAGVCAVGRFDPRTRGARDPDAGRRAVVFRHRAGSDAFINFLTEVVAGAPRAMEIHVVIRQYNQVVNENAATENA